MVPAVGGGEGACGGGGEVGGEDEHRGALVALQEFAPGAPGVVGGDAEAAAPVGLGALERGVDEVAAHHAFAAAGAHVNANMTRGVPGGGVEPDLVVEDVAAVHVVGEPRLEHRVDAVEVVGIVGGSLGTVVRLPVGPIR